MDIRCDCSACQTQFRVNAKYAGRKGKCPNCGAAITCACVRHRGFAADSHTGGQTGS